MFWPLHVLAFLAGKRCRLDRLKWKCRLFLALRGGNEARESRAASHRVAQDWTTGWRQWGTLALRAGLLGTLVLWTGVWCLPAASCPTQYHSRVWQTDEGLPHNAVQAIAQTRDGYLWVGTQSGLARFDGIRFVLVDSETAPALSNVKIMGLLEGRDGSLWVATGHSGLSRLKNGRWLHYTKSDGLADDSCLGTLFESRDGSIWIGTANGLSRFKDDEFTSFGRENGLSSPVVKGMCEDAEGCLWLATSSGVDCWKAGVVVRHVDVLDRLRRRDVRAICWDRGRTFWLGTGDGVSRLREEEVTAFTKKDGATYDIITRLYYDRQGNLWVGAHGGLSRFVDGEFVPELNSEGQAFDMVNAILEDREGNVWVGARDGLIQLKAKAVTCYSRRQGLSHNNVISVLEDRAGTLWIGTWGGGLNQMRGGVVTPYRGQGAFPLLVLGLHEDGLGRLWTGTDFGEGLFQLMKDEPRRYSGNDGLIGSAIRVIYEDTQKRLWVGTSSGLFLANGGRFEPYGTLGECVVRVILEDRSGDLWVGTNDGLFVCREGRATRYSTQNGLAHNRVIALYQDGEGDLWIGTAGGGLNRLRNGEFTAFTSRQGLFCDIVGEILEDDHGWLWFGSPRGIFRASRKNLDELDQGKASGITSITFGRADGMLSEVCNSIAKPAAWKSRDGRLWFATTKGLCLIDPNAEINREEMPPPVFIEQVIADKQAYPSSGLAALAPQLRIPPGRGELEFHYTALSLRLAENNRFKYRLAGVDPDWVEAGNRRVAYYNHIYPGRYEFRVLSCNNDGVWNPVGAAVTVRLSPFFWQTWWFRLLVAVGVAGFFLGLHRLRILQVREIERLRLRIAADLHDDVGSNLGAISLLSRKVQRGEALGKEEREDVAAINRMAVQAASSIREIVWFINPEYDTFQDLILRMKEAATVMLAGRDWRFEHSQEHLDKRLPLQMRQNLFLLFKETLNNVVKHSFATHVEIAIACRDHLWQLTVRDNGVGFEPSSAREGNGLKNLRLRAAKLKGSVTIDSRPGNGTAITFSMRIP